MNQDQNPLTDTRGRGLRDLRISVTDRCNFRCVYCMPKEVFGSDHHFVPRQRLLSFEEIQRVARLSTHLGVSKIRLTGGEPLVRRDIEVLIEELSQIPGISDICLTTNGSLLTAARAKSLKAAGLTRVTISLDALDERRFAAINDVDFPVSKVLDSVDYALNAGLLPVKVNMVVTGHLNDDQLLPMARHFKGSGAILRFIEYMDVGNSNGWQLKQVIPAGEIIRLINQEFPLEPVGANHAGEVASRWCYQDGSGEIGVIASVTQPFCHSCHRARLSAEGRFVSCLFAEGGFDLRALLRSDASDEVVVDTLSRLWSLRDDGYSEIRTEQTVGLKKVEMSYIGG
ncbi:MAG: GTP 3',8-cyclase MoaA [Arenicellales bacterium]|nr:GTP 3',8-cyclase MoaA [Arenicellales bacterium]